MSRIDAPTIPTIAGTDQPQRPVIHVTCVKTERNVFVFHGPISGRNYHPREHDIVLLIPIRHVISVVRIYTWKIEIETLGGRGYILCMDRDDPRSESVAATVAQIADAISHHHDP